MLKQEHQLRSIVPRAHGPSTLAPHDLEHIQVHLSFLAKQSHQTLMTGRNAPMLTLNSPRLTQRTEDIFLNACGVQNALPEATKMECLSHRLDSQCSQSQLRTGNMGGGTIRLKCHALSSP